MTLPIEPFRRATEADAETVDRVVAGARARRARRPRRWLAVGASALFALLGGVALARVALVPPSGPVEVAGAFSVARGPGFSGEGTGRWESGTFTLEEGGVATGAGRAFRIVTREASVEGRDAEVRVSRDVFGTAVDVRSGTVAVACGSAPALPVADERLCPPVSAEGLIARAAALGRGPDAIEALDAAVALADREAVREEALFQRALARLPGDVPGAVADLEAARALRAGARHADSLRALARLHAAAGRCDAAAPLLAELDALGGLGPDAALAASCANSSVAGDRSRPAAPSP